VYWSLGKDLHCILELMYAWGFWVALPAYILVLVGLAQKIGITNASI